MNLPHHFRYESHPQRIVYGEGSIAELPSCVTQLGAERALVLCAAGQRGDAERAAAFLGHRAAGLFDGAVMHVPMAVAREARVLAAKLKADCLVAFGGGSAIGLGKAIALESGMPLIAVPTTYSGSEVTPIYGITDAGIKKTGRDLRVLPRTVIYDPDLTLSLPIGMSVTSGINAIAHAAEGLYAADGNPVVDLMAQEGIAALSRARPGIVEAQDADALRSARRDALYGSWLCGSVLGTVSIALHHKLCHILGGAFNLPHAETHAIVLPHALAYNASAVPLAMERIARALRGADAAQAAFDLARDNGAPIALKTIGLRQQDLDRACDLALANPYANPRPLERAGIRQLLQDAFDGRRPAHGVSQ
ncbi:MAG: maleylacetate reductase [Burkholderiales bacterium]